MDRRRNYLHTLLDFVAIPGRTTHLKCVPCSTRLSKDQTIKKSGLRQHLSQQKHKESLEAEQIRTAAVPGDKQNTAAHSQPGQVAALNFLLDTEFNGNKPINPSCEPQKISRGSNPFLSSFVDEDTGFFVDADGDSVITFSAGEIPADPRIQELATQLQDISRNLESAIGGNEEESELHRLDLLQGTLLGDHEPEENHQYVSEIFVADTEAMLRKFGMCLKHSL